VEVDSLVISLGLDPSKLRQGLNQVLAALQQTMPQAAEFLQGFVEGINEAFQEVADAGGDAAQAMNEAGQAAQEAGQRLEEAGRKGKQGVKEVGGASEAMVQQFNEAVNRFSEGVDKLGQKAQQATAKARQAGSEMQTLGRKWGGFLAGMAARFAAPLAGALSAGAIVGGYMSDVSQVAQMTGRYTTQMEEWRKKRELLSRITREDVELYRKGKLALLDFNFALAGLSTTIMRALSPAIRGGIRLLHSVADWVRRNEPNIIPFVTVLAGTITAVLVPAFGKLALAMLKNPLTWIIGGILLLAIVIDDLVTYIRGGKSEFAGLWSQFGTGEEILAKLRRVWEAVLDGFRAIKPYIPNLLGAAAGVGAVAAAFKAWGVIKGLITGVTVAVRALGVAVAANPIGMIIMLIAALLGALLPEIIEHWDEIKAAFGEAADWIEDKWNNLFNWFSDKFKWVSESWGTIKGIFGGETEKNPYVAPGDAYMISPVGATAEEFMSASVASGAGGRSANVRNDTQIGNLNIITQATDADGIARDMRGSIDQHVASMGWVAADQGVLQ